MVGSSTTGLMPKNGFIAAAGLGGVCTGQGGHQMAAGFGLPPGVDDRAAALADDVVVPVPGFGVDRFAHGAQQCAGCTDRTFRQTRALAHQRADRGGRGVELVDLVLFADLPEAAGVGIGRHAFEHQRGRAIGQRAIDDIAVAGDPAHVGGAPVDVAVVVIEGDLVGHRGIDQIAAGGVHDALGLAGRARGVEDEQRIFGVHLGRRGR